MSTSTLCPGDLVVFKRNVQLYTSPDLEDLTLVNISDNIEGNTALVFATNTINAPNPSLLSYDVLYLVTRWGLCYLCICNYTESSRRAGRFAMYLDHVM